MDFSYDNNEFNTGTMNWDATSKTNSPHRGICPKGWHIPTNDEWTTLNNNENANQSVKLVGDGWPAESQPGYCSAPCPCGTVNHNLSGFSALPAGRVTATNNSTTETTNEIYFWSATCSSNACGYTGIGYASSSLNIQTGGDYRYLHSVHCVRDSE